MSIDMRYDGPDLESEAGGRVQGAVMTAMMVAEGAQQGRSARADRLAGQRLDADRTLWRDTPTDQLGQLGDAALADRWAAAARHHGDSDANQARTAVEEELAQRDPDTMRDYRSWRNACGLQPGEAMQQALSEREGRLAARWAQLASSGAAGLDDGQLLRAWAAAHAAHGTRDTAAQLAAARERGEQLLQEREPELMRGYRALVGQRDGRPGRAGMDCAEAAARTAGGRLAFGPAGWDAVRTGAARTAGAAVRTAVPGAGTAATAAAGLAHRLLRQGRQL